MPSLSPSHTNQANMARLALSFLLFLPLLSLTLARHLTPDDESTSIISVDLPAFSSGPRSYEEATRYIIVPVGRFSKIKSFDNLNDLGFFLHNQHGNGGFGHRYMTDRNVNPVWMKPGGESMEMPRVPMHMQRWQDAEMNGEEYTKEPEEEEMSMEEMEQLRELRKKMRKCRKHRMEHLRAMRMRMPHEHNHGIQEREYNQERLYNEEIKMGMPYRHHHERDEEMEMRMPYRSNGNEREGRYVTEMGMDYRNIYERKDKDEMEMRMLQRYRQEREMGMPYRYQDDQYARPDQSDFWYPYPSASAPSVSEFPQTSGTLSHEKHEIELQRYRQEREMGMAYRYQDGQYARPDQSDFWYPYPPASAPSVSEFPQPSGTLSHEKHEIEKEENVEEEAGGVLKLVTEFVNLLRNPGLF